MPRVESNAHWTVRLFTDDVIQFGEQHFPGSYFGIYVDEIGTLNKRRHYHIAVSFKQPVTNKELTAMLDKAFPHLTGNENRQKKQWRTGQDLSTDKWIQYMFKQNTPTKWGHRDDWPGDEYFEEQSMLKSAEIKVKKESRKKEGQLPQVITDVLAIVKSKTNTVYGQSSSLLSIVVDEYFAYHERTQRRLKGTYMMKTDIENIMFHSGNQLYRREWKDSIMRQITQNLENKLTY